MADRDTIPVAEVVREATAEIDPTFSDPAVEGFMLAFEDDDRPARGLPGLREEFATTMQGIDPEGDSGALGVATALAFFYSGRPEIAEHTHEDVLPTAVRVFFEGDIPPQVRAWLEAEGVAV
jgi:hypothetical protein